MIKYFVSILLLFTQSNLFASDLQINERDPSTAIGLIENEPMPGIIKKIKNTILYKFESTQDRKFTVKLDATGSTSVYELRLLSYNKTNSKFKTLASSLLKTTQINQVSYVSTKDQTLYAEVKLFSGTDKINGYTITYTSSVGFDEAEGDDSPNSNELVNFSTTFQTSLTTDNSWDQDWIGLNLTSSIYTNLSLSNHSNLSIPFGNQVLSLFDSQFNLIGTASFSTPLYINLTAGTYYIKVSGNIASTGYTLSLLNANPTNVVITNITTDGGVNGFVDYGSGLKWRVYKNIVVNGTVYRAGNIPNPGVPVTITISGLFGTSILTGTSGVDGKFSISMKLGPASGQYRYDNVISYHYYDIDLINFKFGAVGLSANINSLYHYAYQIPK